MVLLFLCLLLAQALPLPVLQSIRQLLFRLPWAAGVKKERQKVLQGDIQIIHSNIAWPRLTNFRHI